MANALNADLIDLPTHRGGRTSSLEPDSLAGASGRSKQADPMYLAPGGTERPSTLGLTQTSMLS